MNFAFVKTVKTIAAKTVFKVKANSPEIMLVAGCAAGVACVGLAVWGTVKAVPVVENAKRDLDSMDFFATEEGKEFIEQRNKERAEQGLEPMELELPQNKKTVYAGVAKQMVKIYWPAVVAGCIATGCRFGTYKVLKARYIGAAALAIANDKKFKSFYEAVAAKYGSDAAEKLLYGDENIKTEKKVDPETGVEYEEIVPSKDVPPWQNSIFAITYTNESYSPGFDQAQLEHDQEWWDQKLQNEDFILFTDWVKQFEISQNIKTKGAWCGAGWISEKWIKRLIELGVMKPDEYMGDGHIRYNIFDGRGGEQARLWREGRTRSVVIDPNVDGPVYKYIDIIQELKSVAQEDWDTYLADKEAYKKRGMKTIRKEREDL